MGTVANRYRRRLAAVGPEAAKLRSVAAKALVEGLRAATQEQLYDRTPLPVSHAMMNSIQPYFLGQSVVAVGYNPAKARHARRRLNLSGISPSGHHDLTMRPAPVVRRVADPLIRAASRAAQGRILEAR